MLKCQDALRSHLCCGHRLHLPKMRPASRQPRSRWEARFLSAAPSRVVGTAGKGLLAYVSYLNDKGGVGGRKINYIALDDAYSPPKAVEEIRRLVENDEVAFLFSQLGTPSTAATAQYLAARKVPSIAILSRRECIRAIPRLSLYHDSSSELRHRRTDLCRNI